MGRPAKLPPSEMTDDLLADGLVTIADASTFLAVSERLVWRLMSTGDLPYTKIGGARRIPKVAVKRLALQGLRG